MHILHKFFTLRYLREINFWPDLFLRGLNFEDFAVFYQIRENLSPQNLSYSSIRENKYTQNFCRGFFLARC